MELSNYRFTYFLYGTILFDLFTHLKIITAFLLNNIGLSYLKYTDRTPRIYQNAVTKGKQNKNSI